MSVGEVGVKDSATDHSLVIEAELRAGEVVRRTWTASNVRWANQWQTLPDAPTSFAATDRRVIFTTDAGTTSIGYEHVRAVETDSADEGADLSTAFHACGASACWSASSSPRGTRPTVPVSSSCRSSSS